MKRDDIKVKCWSFCPRCKGGRMVLSEKCETCNGTGKVFELVPLESLSGSIRKGYETAQADFIREQLKRR